MLAIGADDVDELVAELVEEPGRERWELEPLAGLAAAAERVGRIEVPAARAGFDFGGVRRKRNLADGHLPGE